MIWNVVCRCVVGAGYRGVGSSVAAARRASARRAAGSVSGCGSRAKIDAPLFLRSAAYGQDPHTRGCDGRE